MAVAFFEQKVLSDADGIQTISWPLLFSRLWRFIFGGIFLLIKSRTRKNQGPALYNYYQLFTGTTCIYLYLDVMFLCAVVLINLNFPDFFLRP